MTWKALALRGCTLLAALALATTAVLADTSGGAAQRPSWAAGRVRLTLENDGGRCQVLVQGPRGQAQRLATALPWPCNFHQNQQGKVRSLRAGAWHLALLETSTRAGTDCNTQLQGVRINGTRTQVSKHHDRVASCPPFQWDEMVFNALY